MTIKKIIAREWLYLIGFVVLGFIILPLLLKIILDPQEHISEFFIDFFDRLSRKEWIVWLVAIGPYIVFQFIRSIAWAIRVIRK